MRRRADGPRALRRARIAADIRAGWLRSLNGASRPPVFPRIKRRRAGVINAGWKARYCLSRGYHPHYNR